MLEAGLGDFNTTSEAPGLISWRIRQSQVVFSFGHRDSDCFGPRLLRPPALFNQDIGTNTARRMQGCDHQDEHSIVRTAAPSRAFDFENPERVLACATQSRWLQRVVAFRVSWPSTTRSGKSLESSGKCRDPDRLSHAASLPTPNHLVDDDRATPGIVATIPELQLAGFH